jgi:hypothetical protein
MGLMYETEFFAHGRGFVCPRCWGTALAALVLLWSVASSAEEIQGSDPAAPGHWQIEQRFGYVTTFESTVPGTPAALVSNHAVTGETEIGYSPADWYEIALTSPYAYARMNNTMMMPGAISSPGDYALQSGGFTIRQTFIQSDREERTVFFGVVVRAIFSPPGSLTPDLFVANKQRLGGAQAPSFVQEADPRFAGMLTPIVGVHLPDDFEMIFNGNLDFAIGTAGSAFEPSIRIVKHLNDKLAIGIEYFANVGPIDHWLPINQQMQTPYAVADTKFMGLEWSFGLGYGLTAAFRGLAFKTSVGKDF